MHRINNLISALSGFLLLFSCAPGKDLEKQLENSFSKTAISNSWFSGLMVYEPASNNVIFEHNVHKYFTPASNTKIFTFYAALKTLEDSIPAIKYNISNDTLYFAPTGDPTFLHRDFDSSKLLNFFKSRPETLALIYPETPEKRFGPGWAWDDYNYSFSAERSPFPIYGNSVNFSFSPEDSLVVEPAYFKNMVFVDSTGNSTRVQRALNKNIFKTAIFGTSASQQSVPFITSAEITAQLLSDTLEKEVHLIQSLPKHVDLQQKLISQPADSLYKRMLQDSDNFFAEQLLLMAAGEISDSLQTEIAIKYVHEKFLQEIPDKVKWVDGSGLSRYNLFTPRSMVWVLNEIYEEVPQERLFTLLPAGGVSGTLRNSYKAPPGKPPFIYAKSGTLSNNHSLSGYLVTASGKILIFSFMNSNYLVPTAVVKENMDRILRDLYLNY